MSFYIDEISQMPQGQETDMAFRHRIINKMTSISFSPQEQKVASMKPDALSQILDDDENSQMRRHICDNLKNNPYVDFFKTQGVCQPDSDKPISVAKYRVTLTVECLTD